MASTPRGYTQFPSQEELFYFCTTSSTSEEDLNLHYTPPSQSSLKIGVLIFGPDQVQLLDLAVVDLLAMVSRNRISKLHAPETVLDEAVDELDIRYVSETGEGSFPITSGARMPVTNSFANAPQFNVLIIPGSFSPRSLSPTATTFLTTQSAHATLTAILAVSSGILHLAPSDLLHRVRATAPACLLPALQHSHPDTAWQAAPWTRDDKLWSSSSGLAGLDMAAAWLREYFWDRGAAVECALRAAGAPRLDGYGE
ncbi:class I glutamine amidotransferase-like protein [Massariosphaeria phaeospora]|uniref:Class I glutamine amidotransferase-like protein n=1 Tax=Massariosphaeria phaeospora TaxID=100035 RepID=A0A7C8M7F1_9PLEO|nr:class I glutamine amidotransferase-like protein [Massariosphaeria phaeospora]